jgi:transaldolase
MWQRHTTSETSDHMTNLLREIEALGQSIWIDNLNRELLEDGGLRRLIEEDGISGVTSNPTIFEKAMGHSDRYDDAFRAALQDTQDPQQIFERLAYGDVRDAADQLRETFDRTGGQDGYVSFELPASLAFDAEGSVEAAVHHRDAIDRPNVLIKVPGTAQGVRAFEELTARGVNVNVTLLFAVARYEEIAEAYLRGLERRVRAGERVDRSASVASFFVSRVDTKVDAALEGTGREDLCGKAAVANAKLAYDSFRHIFAGPRWDALKAVGASVQRPLWGSTSTKNPDYPDTLYVDELIGPDTVNTMPDATIGAARDHATPARTVDRDVDRARDVMRQVREAGVDVDRIVLDELVDEGVKAFADSYDSLLSTLERKASELVHAGR